MLQMLPLLNTSQLSQGQGIAGNLESILNLLNAKWNCCRPIMGQTLISIRMGCTNLAAVGACQVGLGYVVMPKRHYKLFAIVKLRSEKTCSIHTSLPHFIVHHDQN